MKDKKKNDHKKMDALEIFIFKLNKKTRTTKWKQSNNKLYIIKIKLITKNIERNYKYYIN